MLAVLKETRRPSHLAPVTSSFFSLLYLTKTFFTQLTPFLNPSCCRRSSSWISFPGSERFKNVMRTFKDRRRWRAGLLKRASEPHCLIERKRHFCFSCGSSKLVWALRSLANMHRCTDGSIKPTEASEPFSFLALTSAVTCAPVCRVALSWKLARHLTRPPRGATADHLCPPLSPHQQNEERPLLFAVRQFLLRFCLRLHLPHTFGNGGSQL